MSKGSVNYTWRKKYSTVQNIAIEAGVCPQSIYSGIREGKIKSVNMHGKIVIDREEFFRSYVKGGRRGMVKNGKRVFSQDRLSVTDIARLFSCAPQFIYSIIKSGKIRPVFSGCPVVIHKDYFGIIEELVKIRNEKIRIKDERKREGALNSQ